MTTHLKTHKAKISRKNIIRFLSFLFSSIFVLWLFVIVVVRIAAVLCRTTKLNKVAEQKAAKNDKTQIPFMSENEGREKLGAKGWKGEGWEEAASEED